MNDLHLVARVWGWIFVAAITYPLLVFGACLVAVMPPINIVLIPPWIALSMGAVGTISNAIADARSAVLVRRAGPLELPPSSTRYAPLRSPRLRNAPGVSPVQRTKAL